MGDSGKAIVIQRIFFAAFWMFCTFGFISDELLPIETLRTAVMLMCDAVVLALGLYTLRSSNWAMLSVAFFMLYAFMVTKIYNGYLIPFFLNGTRDFFGLLFYFPIFRWFCSEDKRREQFIAQFDKSLTIFLWLQLICIPWQLLKYGAGDHGGGSFGNWYSGIVSLSIYCASFYLINKRIDTKRFFRSLWENKSYIFLLIPTFMNETKISFVLIFLYFVLLMPIDFKMFVRVLLVMPLLAILVWVGSMIYHSQQSGYDFMSEEFLLDYFISDLDEAESDAKWSQNQTEGGETDIPRFTKFLLMEQLDEEHPGHIMTGFGVGHFKGGTLTKQSDLSQEYDWLFYGTIPYAIHVYVQLGVIGLIWMIANFWMMFAHAPATVQRRNLNVHLYLLLIVMMIQIYNEAYRGPEFSFFFVGVLVCSWLSPKDGALQNHADENPAVPTIHSHGYATPRRNV